MFKFVPEREANPLLGRAFRQTEAERLGWQFCVVMEDGPPLVVPMTSARKIDLPGGKGWRVEFRGTRNFSATCQMMVVCLIDDQGRCLHKSPHEKTIYGPDSLCVSQDIDARIIDGNQDMVSGSCSLSLPSWEDQPDLLECRIAEGEEGQ